MLLAAAPLPRAAPGRRTGGGRRAPAPCRAAATARLPWWRRALARPAPDLSGTAVVGAGPHALSLLVHLADAGVPPERLPRVVDDGAWLSAWHANFDAQEIEFLRSPVVHHSGVEGMALREFAEAQGRLAEVRPSGKTAVPSARLFRDYEALLEARCECGGRLLPGRVEGIEPKAGAFGITLAGGGELEADRVVYAGGNGPLRLPEWAGAAHAGAPPGRLLHAGDVDLPRLGGVLGAGAHVAVVGGGLTSAHLAIGVLRRGGRVTLIVRAPELRVQPFDFPPIWVGPPRIRQLQQEPDYAVRARQVNEARGGGSITPETAQEIFQAVAEGRAEVLEGHEVSRARWAGDAWDLSVGPAAAGAMAPPVAVSAAGGGELAAPAPAPGGAGGGGGGDRRLEGVSYVFCCTGTDLDAAKIPVLAGVLRASPTPLYGGLPPLGPRLDWPGLPRMHVMGGLAGLSLGPAARNLAGARKGARLIAGGMLRDAGARDPFADG